MPKRKKAIRYARVGEKDLWHPYGLQGLSSDRFAKVANLILRGRFGLICQRTGTVIDGQTNA